MKTTIELIKKYVQNFYTGYNFNELSIDDYILHGDIIIIKWSKLRENITEMDIKYNTHRTNNEIEINLLDYITFVSQHQKVEPCQELK
jgi:hypothetical protein